MQLSGISASEIMHKLEGVDKDTCLRVDDLNMKQSESYKVIVTATDEMDNCAVREATFEVDETPPTQGVVGVGNELNDKVCTTVSSKSNQLYIKLFHSMTYKAP